MCEQGIAVLESGLSSIAPDIIQIDRASTLSKGSQPMTNGTTSGIAQLYTDHSSISVVPEVIAHSPPGSVATDLNTTFTLVAASLQPQAPLQTSCEDNVCVCVCVCVQRKSQ